MFLHERRILERETSRGAYRVSSYVASNAAVFLPFLLAAAVLYAAPVYWLVGLAREPVAFAYFALVVWRVRGPGGERVRRRARRQGVPRLGRRRGGTLRARRRGAAAAAGDEGGHAVEQPGRHARLRGRVQGALLRHPLLQYVK